MYYTWSLYFFFNIQFQCDILQISIRRRNAITSKQYCPECHIEMDYKAKDEYWICPECGHTTDLDDVKLGIDYPTLESEHLLLVQVDL